MQIITLSVDPTQQAQVVWSPDLNCFLRLYAIQSTDLQNDLAQAQTQLSNAQNAITALAAQIALEPPPPAPPAS